ncbi:MAG TPA: hypothetical protein VIJ75_12625 [Hanamia sp.]
MKNEFKILISLLIWSCFITGCKKSTPDDSNTGGGGRTVNPPVDSTYNPVDPPLAATVGFFQDGWQAKSFQTPGIIDGTSASGIITDSLTVNLNKVLAKVPVFVYGNNSNLWMGQIVTEPALMGYLQDLSPNIIRAPAGSVSDIYFLGIYV